MNLTLAEHQDKVLEIIKEKRQFGVFFTMGAGKTPTILSLIEYLMFEKLEEVNVLIVAPAQVITKLRVWQKEIEKWNNFKLFDYDVLEGTPEKRQEKVKKNKNSITLMNDTLVTWWYQTYGNLNKFNMIIIDESSRFKNPQAKKFKAMAKMIDLEKHRVYLLTGTPMSNGLQNLWAQIYLLDKGQRLGSNYYKWIDKNFYKFGYRISPYPGAKNTTIDLIKDLCTFAKGTFKLPDLTVKKIMFKLSPEKQKIFNSFAQEYVLELGERDISVLSKATMINKCLQLSNGFAYYGKEGKYVMFDDNKLKWVYKYSLDNPDKNFLVFYPFKTDKSRLLTLEGAEEIYTPESVDKWNEGKIKIGVISPHSFQFGGNLQFGGSTIVWYGLLWDEEKVSQSNARLVRPGQTRDCEIIYLIHKNTFDERVYDVVVSKERSQAEVMEAINVNMIIGEQK